MDTEGTSELHGPYIDAPVWPWSAAGWALGALFIVLFLVAWFYGGRDAALIS
jgi:hypothetical protein